MTTVLEISPADRLVVVQPGTVDKALRDAVAGSGLSYPPDPHRSIKAALDPAGLLNPGTVFRPAGPTAGVVR